MSEDYKAQLNIYRQDIDTIDKKLIDLLNDRTELALKIREVKIKNKLPFYQPEREKIIFTKLAEYNQGPFPNERIPGIFKEIILASREAQGNVKVAYLGPRGSYTHLACVREFGKFVDSYAMTTISDVFKVVENENIEYGVVPVENSYEGMVNRTLDALSETPVKILAEIYLPISHCLLSHLDDTKKIKKIYSHPQAFAQCRLWLENNLPNVEKIEESSTAKAAEIVEWDKYSAAIASEISSDLYNLTILAKDIQTSSQNTTRFLVIGRNHYDTTLHDGDKFVNYANNESIPTGDDKTSIICTIKDEPGALMKILQPFHSKNLNLSKIESRPSRKKSWDYLFFFDVIAHSSDSELQKTIDEIQKVCFSVKILGSYPRGLEPTS